MSEVRVPFKLCLESNVSFPPLAEVENVRSGQRVAKVRFRARFECREMTHLGRSESPLPAWMVATRECPLTGWEPSSQTDP